MEILTPLPDIQGVLKPGLIRATKAVVSIQARSHILEKTDNTLDELIKIVRLNEKILAGDRKEESRTRGF